jgi:superfamily II DNA or RNA helicase
MSAKRLPLSIPRRGPAKKGQKKTFTQKRKDKPRAQRQASLPNVNLDGVINAKYCSAPSHPYWCPKKKSWCVSNPGDCKYTKEKLIIARNNLNYSTLRSSHRRPRKIAVAEIDVDAPKNVIKDIIQEASIIPQAPAGQRLGSVSIATVRPNEQYIQNLANQQVVTKTAKYMEIALITQHAEAVRLIKYPSPADDFTKFMRDVLEEFGERLKIHVDYANAFDLCNDTEFPELTVYQKFAATYLTPRSPYKGLILYHSVGSGKTISAFSILRSFRNRFDNLWWITSVAQRREIQNRVKDFRAFDHEITIDKSGIVFKSYEQLRNILTKSNQEGRDAWGGEAGYKKTGKTTWSTTSKTKDPLKKTIIIIDEAHLIFNEKEGTAELIEQAIWDSYKKSGINSVRIVLMTATPIPGGEKNLTDAEKLARVFTPLRLMNMLIHEDEKRFPIDKDAFVTEFIDQSAKKFRMNKFKEQGKGLVSYFAAGESVWTRSAFAVTNKEPRVIVKGQKQLVAKLQKKGSTCTTGKDKASRYLCYRKAAGWAPKEGQFPPESWKVFSKSFNPTTVLKQMKDVSAKVVEIVEHIKKIDQEDQQNHNKTFKHAIYSNLGTAMGLQPISAILEASGYPHLNAALSLDSSNAPKLSARINNTTDKTSNFVLVFDNNLRQDESKEMFKAFNDHKNNNYGQIARIAVLDNKYKEGIDLFDVRYLHIVEPQLSDTDETQVVGRAVRRCGHTGLPENERNVQVYTYDVLVPRAAIVTDKPGNEDPVQLGDHIVYNLKGEALIESLSKIIINALKVVAVDRDLLYPKKKKPAKREISVQMKEKFANVLNMCLTNWKETQDRLMELHSKGDLYTLEQELSLINAQIENTENVLLKSNEIRALITIHAQSYRSQSDLERALEQVTSLKLNQKDVVKIEAIMKNYCSHINAILSIVEPKQNPTIGKLTESPPSHRVTKDSRQFHLKYPKVKRFDLLEIKDLDQFIFQEYFASFFSEDLARRLKTMGTIGMPAPLKDLFEDFNYHPDVVLQFGDQSKPFPSFVAFPVFKWEERSTIDFTRPPSLADIRAMFLISMQLKLLKIFIRDNTGIPTSVGGNINLEPEIIKNVAEWFKIPDLDFLASV